MPGDEATYEHGARPIHARRVWTSPALCGDVGPSQWTDTRSYVTCGGCEAEIDRRLAARQSRNPLPPAAEKGP